MPGCYVLLGAIFCLNLLTQLVTSAASSAIEDREARLKGVYSLNVAKRENVDGVDFDAFRHPHFRYFLKRVGKNATIELRKARTHKGIHRKKYTSHRDDERLSSLAEEQTKKAVSVVFDPVKLREGILVPKNKAERERKKAARLEAEKSEEHTGPEMPSNAAPEPELSDEDIPGPPPPPFPDAPPLKPLPAGWEELQDTSSGRFYYFHILTGKTTWDRPRDDEAPTTRAARNVSVM